MNKQGCISVLVAEDEQIILEDIIEKIEKADRHFKVTASAMNGEDALRLVEQIKPDVLFTDIRMPVMDGLELIRNVKKIHPGIHIVILSGYDEFSYAQQAIKLGVRDYLLKPLKLELLTETIMSIENEIAGKLSISEKNMFFPELDGNRTSETLPSEELYKMLEEYIRLNYAKQINVEFIARKFNFNPSYVIRVFKKYKGETPMQYLISLRINEAMRLIESQQYLDFKYISEIVGYTDQHYFSRVFKNITGKSPSEYRESLKNVQ